MQYRLHSCRDQVVTQLHPWLSQRWSFLNGDEEKPPARSGRYRVGLITAAISTPPLQAGNELLTKDELLRIGEIKNSTRTAVQSQIARLREEKRSNSEGRETIVSEKTATLRNPSVGRIFWKSADGVLIESGRELDRYRFTKDRLELDESQVVSEELPPPSSTAISNPLELFSQIEKEKSSFLSSPASSGTLDHRDNKKSPSLAVPFTNRGLFVKADFGGNVFEPEDQLHLLSPTNDHIITIPCERDWMVHGYDVRSSRHEAVGTLIWLHVHYLAKKVLADTSPQEQGSEHYLYIRNPQGQVNSFTPERVLLPDGQEFISLGHHLAQLRRGTVELHPLPKAIGAHLGTHDFQDKRYLVFAGIEGGQLAFLIDPSSGKPLSKEGHQGVVLADGFGFSNDGKSLFQLIPTTHKREKKVRIETLPQQKAPQQRKEGVIDDIEDEAMVDTEMQSFLAEFDPSTISDHQAAVARMGRLEKALSPMSIDPRYRQAHRDVASLTKEYNDIVTKLLDKERNLVEEQARFQVAIEAFQANCRDMEGDLPVNGDIGRYIDRLERDTSIRQMLEGVVKKFTLLPTDYTNRTKQQLFAQRDQIVKSEQAAIAEILLGNGEEGDLAHQLRQGRVILETVKSAQPPDGHLQLADKREAYEKWLKTQAVFRRLQQNTDLFFSADEQGQKARMALLKAFEKSKTDGIRVDGDPQSFSLAHIEAYAETIVIAAQEKNVDPAREAAFVLEINGMEALGDEMQTADDPGRIAQIGQEIEKGLARLAPYRADAQRFAQQMRKLEEELPRLVDTALRKQESESVTLQKKLADKITEDRVRFGDQVMKAAIYETDVSSEDASRAAMHRIQELFYGFDLQHEGLSQIGEGSRSPALTELLKKLDTYTDRYANEPFRKSFWQELRDYRSRAISEVEIQKGVDIKNRRYVLKFPEAYQDLVDETVSDIILPLSGKSRDGRLKVERKFEFQDGEPKLIIRVLGSAYSVKSRYLKKEGVRAAAAARHWESPQEKDWKNHYVGAEISREEMIAYWLIENLFGANGSPTLNERLKILRQQPGNAEQRQYIDEELRKIIAEFAQTRGMELESFHITNGVEIFLRMISSNEEVDEGNLKKWWAQEKAVDLTGLKAEHPRLQAKGFSLSPHDLQQQAQEFLRLHEKGIMALNEYVDRNTKRVARRFGLLEKSEDKKDDKKEEKTHDADLPPDFCPTGLDMMRILWILNTAERVKANGDKTMIAFIGSPGSGKTTLLKAMRRYMQNMMTLVQGNRMNEATSLDPAIAPATAAPDVLKLSVGLLHSGVGDMVVVDEAVPHLTNILENEQQFCDKRRQGRATYADIPDAESFDIDVFPADGKFVWEKGVQLFLIGNDLADFSHHLTDRMEYVDDDKICELYPLLWKAAQIEKGSADLGVHPEDLQLVIGRTIAGRKISDEDRAPMKTDFKMMGEDAFKHVQQAVENRVIASSLLQELQLRVWKTNRVRGKVHLLGVPSCKIGVGQRDVKALMPMITHEDDERSTRLKVYEYVLRHHKCSPEDTLFLEYTTKIWKEYDEEKWTAAVDKAERDQRLGLAPNPEVAAVLEVADAIRTLPKKLDEQLSKTHPGLLTPGAENAKTSAAIESFRKAVKAVEKIGKALDKKFGREFGEVTTDTDKPLDEATKASKE
jgi:energy-coupling factor transporter ATP-binding protein EcfA2